MISKMMKSVCLLLLFNLLPLNAGVASNNNSDELLVFVSFSMPEPVLKSWLIDADSLRASVVLRGLINDSWPQTLTKIKRLVDQAGTGGMQIDPTLFQTFGIEQVPAIVRIRKHGEPCDQTDSDCSEYGRFDVISGNISLSYALDKFKSLDEVGDA